MVIDSKESRKLKKKYALFKGEKIKKHCVIIVLGHLIYDKEFHAAVRFRIARNILCFLACVTLIKVIIVY